MAVALQNLGNAQGKFRQFTDALASYQEMSTILEKLIAAHAGNARFRFALFVSYQKTALTLAQLNRYEEAAVSYTRALELLRDLQEQDELIPANQEWIVVGELVLRKYQNAALALGDWETVLAQPVDLQVLLLDLRGSHFVREGRFREAIQAADTLRKLKPSAIWPVYNAACVYARSAEALSAAPEGLSTEQTAEQQRLIRESFATIREAIAIGWHDIAHLQHDIDLSALREQPEFQVLVDELKARLKAQDPAHPLTQ